MSTDTGGPLAASNNHEPLDTLAQWGYEPVPAATGERPWLSPGTPPWAGQPEPEGEPVRRPWHLVAIVAGLLLVVLAGFVLIARYSNALPVWLPVVGKDTGIAACEALASGDKIRTLDKGNGTVRGSRMTEAEYQQIRAIFSDSRYSEIRTNGSAMVDYVWQFNELGPESALAALPLVGPLNQAYSGLSGGCAQHGIILPPLGS